ncbi:MAG: DUF4317 domain-containing protein [Clostridia bacterium]|nr:DUF4317 domain-containing protein [Clostridia bacterium]
MNRKELYEIKRRLNPDRTTIGKVFGCYVNTAKNVIAEFETSVGRMDESEKEQILTLFKGALSGRLGKNLLTIPFSVQEDVEGSPYRLLYDLRRTSLADADLRRAFCQKIIDSFAIEDTNLLILLADDVYDVPKRNKNGDDEGSEEVFHYILCAVCPVKDGRPGLGYDYTDKSFHPAAARQMAGAPAVGFLFPSFDGRTANVHAALYFTKNAGDLSEDFIDGVFGTPAPMSSVEQKDTFCEVLAEALDEDCSFEVVQAVNASLREKVVQHKESRDPEVLEMSADEVGEILADSGVDDGRVSAFRTRCNEKFGGDTILPENILPASKFHLKTTEAKITVEPDAAAFIETRVIDGRKYILIPADAGVEINGLNVRLKE